MGQVCQRERLSYKTPSRDLIIKGLLISIKGLSVDSHSHSYLSFHSFILPTKDSKVRVLFFGPHQSINQSCNRALSLSPGLHPHFNRPLSLTRPLRDHFDPSGCYDPGLPGRRSHYPVERNYEINTITNLPFGIHIRSDPEEKKQG